MQKVVEIQRGGAVDVLYRDGPRRWVVAYALRGGFPPVYRVYPTRREALSAMSIPFARRNKEEENS